MLPKVRFREMTLEENIEIIKWSYFEKDESLDIHNYTIQLFPSLQDIDNNLSKEKVYKIIENIVTKVYENNKETIKKEVKRYNKIWNKYNDIYFESLYNYLNTKIDNIKIIYASIGIIPVSPRYLDTYSFSTTINLNDKDIIAITAHETLHFMWFNKWKELYPDCKRYEYDTPYLAWKYSEMVTDPILNSKEIKNILNIDEKAYDSFYTIKDNNTSMMANLINIYNKDQSIEEKIKEGYEYIKKVLEKTK
ncbi:MAG: hypothetical protein IJD92_00805 [Bacilli bacterium]|nr:hypothetical protein [Bacilli bacterium]